MWIRVAVAVEIMALLGVAGVLVTRRTFAAFVTGFNTMGVVTAVYLLALGAGPRAVLAAVLVGVYLARMNWVLFAWSGNTAMGKLDDRTPVAGKLVLPVVLANTAGWAYALPVYFAARSGDPPGVRDIVAVVLYLAGTVFHFGGDYQKRRFKLRGDTKGKLLETGFWALCRHPNYFGDFVIYVSLAVLGGSAWAWIAPAMNLVQYAFDAIPKNERWAAERYGAAWGAYRKRTRAFVPYLV